MSSISKLKWYEDSERRPAIIANLKAKHKSRLEHDISMQIKGEPLYWQWRKDVAVYKNSFCMKCDCIAVQACITFKHGTIKKGFEEFGIQTLQQAIDCKELWSMENAMLQCKSCYKVKRNKKRG